MKHLKQKTWTILLFSENSFRQNRITYFCTYCLNGEYWDECNMTYGSRSSKVSHEDKYFIFIFKIVQGNKQIHWCHCDEDYIVMGVGITFPSNSVRIDKFEIRLYLPRSSLAVTSVSTCMEILPRGVRATIWNHCNVYKRWNWISESNNRFQYVNR